MPLTSEAIIERFRTRYGKDIDLTLRTAYHELLEKLGNPQLHLPPVFHVAGTNGKGSTCAFLRAIFEAAGKRVHVYTSPHLVHIHERIRISGSLITETELASILAECERLAEPGGVSYFEAWTAAALTAFARHEADVTLLEVGLGGRLDATNVIAPPVASIITRLSYDHREYLGDTLDAIAREKAGIMQRHTPCFTAPQPSSEALIALRDEATRKGVPLYVGDVDWKVTPHADGTFLFEDSQRRLDLPAPILRGAHQYMNAGLAIAALSAWSERIPPEAITRGLRQAFWPARLQLLQTGPLRRHLPLDWELWLDGGHNDSAGEVLANQIEIWRREDGEAPRPLYIVCGMLTTKVAPEFLGPFAKRIEALRTVSIPGEPLSQTAEGLLQNTASLGLDHAAAAESVAAALKDLAADAGKTPRARVLICGSLYLAGQVLRENGSI